MVKAVPSRFDDRWWHTARVSGAKYSMANIAFISFSTSYFLEECECRKK
jgi:hypothetical protein